MIGRYFNDPELMLKLLSQLMDGVGVTARIFALTLLFAMPLGIFVAIGRMSRHRLLRWPVSFYIYIMRSTPLMLQLLFFYFMIPSLLQPMGVRLDRIWYVLFSFVINYAAYFAEIFRGGIQSISDGQTEAGQVLGLTRAQIFLRIILPQAFKRVIPPITNEVVTLVKDTALASVIGVMDLMTQARGRVTSSGNLDPYLVAVAIYLALNGIAEQACRFLERRFNYYR